MSTNNLQVQFMPTIRHQHLYQLVANKTLLEIYIKYYQEYNSKLVKVGTMFIERSQAIIHEAEQALAIREKALDSVFDTKMQQRETNIRHHTDAQLKVEENKSKAMNENYLAEIQAMMVQHTRDISKLEKQ